MARVTHAWQLWSVAECIPARWASAHWVYWQRLAPRLLLLLHAHRGPQVTLQCVPAHRLEEKVYTATAAEIRRDREALLQNQHMRLMWIPHTDTVVVVCCNPTTSPVTQSSAQAGEPTTSPAKRINKMQLPVGTCAIDRLCRNTTPLTPLTLQYFTDFTVLYSRLFERL